MSTKSVQNLHVAAVHQPLNDYDAAYQILRPHNSRGLNQYLKDDRSYMDGWLHISSYHT